MEKCINKSKEINFERICKLHGKCGNEIHPYDSTRITLYGLCCLNKHNEKASC